MSANTIWTADRIVNLLNTVGFSAADAKTGTYLAKWLLSGKHLDGKFLAKGRNIAIKYRRQLSEIAAEKPAAS